MLVLCVLSISAVSCRVFTAENKYGVFVLCFYLLNCHVCVVTLTHTETHQTTNTFHRLHLTHRPLHTHTHTHPHSRTAFEPRGGYRIHLHGVFAFKESQCIGVCACIADDIFATWHLSRFDTKWVVASPPPDLWIRWNRWAVETSSERK